MLRGTIGLLLVTVGLAILLGTLAASAEEPVEDHRLEYIVFSPPTEDGGTVEVYINGLRFKGSAEEFLRTNTDLVFEDLKNTTARANQSMTSIFRLEEKVEGVWRTATNTSIRCFFVAKSDQGAEDSYRNPDGLILRWNDIVNASGMVTLDIQAPFTSVSTWFVTEVGLGGGIGWIPMPGTEAQLRMTVPEGRISCILYNISRVGQEDHLSIIHHNFASALLALDYLNATTEVTFDSWTENDAVYKNDTISVVCTLEIQDMASDWEWKYLTEGSGILYVLRDFPTLDNYAWYSNGTLLVFEMFPSEDGVARFDFVAPGWGWSGFQALPSEEEYFIRFATFGGAYDPYYRIVPEANGTFTVLPPQLVVLEDVRILEDKVYEGETVTVIANLTSSGTGRPVSDTEVVVSGTHVSTFQGITDENGSVSIRVYAPIMAFPNLTLHIEVEGSDRFAGTSYDLKYDVLPTPQPPPAQSPNYFMYAGVLVIAVISIVAAIWALSGSIEDEPEDGERGTV